MRLDGTYTATLDRLEEGQAVLLVESDGETVDERHCPAAELPAEAAEGSVCELTFADDELVDVAVRPDETADRRRRLRERFESLSRRPGEEREDDDADGNGPR